MISVVIPAYNEREYLPACLESLARQDYAGDYEIIVVDNGSTDDTAAIAAGLGARVVTQRQKGIALSRQAGFLAARGDVIASTDADTVLPENWLRCIDGMLADTQTIAVGGFYRLTRGSPIVRCWTELSGRVLPLAQRLRPGLVSFCGSNFAVKRGAFSIVGGFNTELKHDEDTDLCRRLRGVGRVVIDFRLLVTTTRPCFYLGPIRL
jgi:glycosyltransferase involved in cell wall biosynthesis